MTKTLFTALLIVVTLPGCAKLPGTPSQVVEQMTTVHHAVAVHVVPAPPAAETADVSGMYVNHGTPTRTMGGTPIDPTVVASPTDTNTKAPNASASGSAGTP